MSITTRTGDDGETCLYAGKRVSKASERVHALGTLDELNAVLGAALAEKVPKDIGEQLSAIQHLLFVVGADIATPFTSDVDVHRVDVEDIHRLDELIDELEGTLSPLTNFILPGGTRAGAFLHQARTACRRAERHVVGLNEREEINDCVQMYLNRLSDYLFLAARAVNKDMGIEEEEI